VEALCRDLGAEAGDRTVVLLLVLDWWIVAAGAVQPSVVVPVDVLQGGELDVAQALPRAAAADEPGSVQADKRLGCGVVKAAALAADRPGSAGGVEPVAVQRRSTG
jgi:hypothetical protein